MQKRRSKAPSHDAVDTLARHVGALDRYRSCAERSSPRSWVDAVSMMVKLAPFTGSKHVGMFWTFDRLQLFVWSAKIRNKRASDERIVPERTQPSPKERAEREDRRVRLWSERKEAMWHAMQAENAKAGAARKSLAWPRQ